MFPGVWTTSGRSESWDDLDGERYRFTLVCVEPTEGGTRRASSPALEGPRDDIEGVRVIREQCRVLQNVQKRLEHDILEVHVWLGANTLDRVLDAGRFDGGLCLRFWSTHQ